VTYLLLELSAGSSGALRHIKKFPKPPINQQALVISIKKFLTTNAESDQTVMHIVRLLIQGIGKNAFKGDADDCARFRETVQEVVDALTDEISPAELLVRAGSLLKAFEDHTGRVTRHQHLQTLELQNMIKMLTSTVGVVSSVSNANIGRLNEIEKQVVVVSELDDVRIIKSRLSDCLADIRTEAERQRKETGEIIEHLSHEIDLARKPRAGTSKGESQDPVTGLPLRSEAEAALSDSGREGRQAYAAVLVLDRLSMLAARFGRQEGNNILVEYVHMVQKQLLRGDRLFRWDERALIALLPRPEALLRVRSEFGRIIEVPLEYTIQTPSRSILLPIMPRWTMFPIMAAPRLVFQKIDAFAAGPTPHE
jgi:GGDEF domain-containing protein